MLISGFEVGCFFCCSELNCRRTNGYFRALFCYSDSQSPHHTLVSCSDSVDGTMSELCHDSDRTCSNVGMSVSDSGQIGVVESEVPDGVALCITRCTCSHVQVTMSVLESRETAGVCLSFCVS